MDKWQLLLGSAIKASLNGKITLARTAITRLMQLREMPEVRQQKFVEAALELIASFQAFNDVAGMCRHHDAVYELLDDPRDFYLTNDSWTFEIPSVVYMFWREPGKLAETIQLVREGVPRYAVIGGGKGLGAPEVMYAEARLLSGDENECKMFTSQAKFIAAEHGQDSIYFCTLTLKMCIRDRNGTSWTGTGSAGNGITKTSVGMCRWNIRRCRNRNSCLLYTSSSSYSAPYIRWVG